MTTLGAQPAKGPSTQWEVMVGLSPETASILHPHGARPFRLWSRLHDGEHQFAAVPGDERPAENEPRAKNTLHQARLEILVERVKDHARANYSKGWDIIVECWEDRDILKAIQHATTIADAIRKVGAVVNVHEDRRRDVMGEIF